MLMNAVNEVSPENDPMGRLNFNSKVQNFGNFSNKYFKTKVLYLWFFVLKELARFYPTFLELLLKRWVG